MPELRSWGVIWTKAIPHSDGYMCEKENCVWRLPVGLEKYKHIVGFEYEPIENYNRSIVGKAIFQCPVCFENFWIHFGERMVRLSIEYCLNWPKN